MAVLYRKYRSQTFGEVVGQKFVIRTLKNQAASGNPAHAYLFTGGRGIGKTTLARLMAKAVNCLKSKDGEPCGKCEVCKQIEAGNFLDLVEIDAASNTGVDNIRELIEHVKFSPSIGKYKVFIIDEVHMLSKGAFNALLKTLEEPPSHSIFILATTEIDKVPPTIVSRTQRFDFKRLSQAEIKEHLKDILKAEKTVLGDGALELVAANSDGSIRDSLSLLDKVLTLGGNPDLEECRQLLGVTDLALSENLLELIVGGRVSEIPDFFGIMLGQGIDLAVFNRDFLEYLRKALVFSAAGGATGSKLEEGRQEKLRGLAAASGGIGNIIYIIRLFLKSYKDLGGSPDPSVPLLIAALEAAGKYGRPAAAVRSPVEKAREAAADAGTENAEAESKSVSESAPQAAAYDEMPAGQLVEFWPKIISRVKNINSPLANLMRSCHLRQDGGGMLVLGVKFLFHKQSLEQQKNRQLILDSVREICGKNLGLRAEVVKEEKREQQSPAAALGEALQIFGGELVE